MFKSVKISAVSHEEAKRRADSAGMKLHRFVEMAIEAYQPAVIPNPDATGRARKKPANQSRP